MRSFAWLAALAAFVLPTFVVDAGWVFAGSAENDLWRVATGSGMTLRRFDAAQQAVTAAGPGDGVLLLADGYPERQTLVEAEVLRLAAEKGLRLFVEYPAALPGVQLGTPRSDRLLRGVVASEKFGTALPPMRIVGIHGCTYLPASATQPHLVMAKVAGVDTAVFGLKDTAADPILFECDGGRVLVATTKLSGFVTGRFMPEEDWATVWRVILGHLQPGAEVPRLRWTSTVRPSFGPEEPLPANAEGEAVRRAAAWIRRSGVLRHPSWPSNALAWAMTYNTVRERPKPEWPTGDGSLGLVEGYSSTLRSDGSQPMRYAVRHDCMSEVAMLLALSAATGPRDADGSIAENLVNYTLGSSGLAAGPRADPGHPAYGLIGWALDHPGTYWGDDNARALLGILAVAACRKETRWNEAIVRNVLGNLRTTGVKGFRESNLTDDQLRKNGWRHYWRADNANLSPHMAGWSWACFLWAYDRTGFEPFLTRAESGARALVQAYPKWDHVLGSGSIELARILLPLAWLVRASDTVEHRQWLRSMAAELLRLQEGSGAIRESIRVADGTFKDSPIRSNAEYGTRETSLIQENGDAVADMLYTCNFALIGLHEAFHATGEPGYAEAADRLARFLCRIQVRSEAHPELEGAWYRGFHFGKWQYWASNADWEWGPWCAESGWSAPWIAGTLALREQKTSLWDLVRRVDIRPVFDRYRREMLPDDALVPSESAPRTAVR